jgi:hypothetical protein
VSGNITAADDDGGYFLYIGDNGISVERCSELPNGATEPTSISKVDASIASVELQGWGMMTVMPEHPNLILLSTSYPISSKTRSIGRAPANAVRFSLAVEPPVQRDRICELVKTSRPPPSSLGIIDHSFKEFFFAVGLQQSPRKMAMTTKVKEA